MKKDNIQEKTLHVAYSKHQSPLQMNKGSYKNNCMDNCFSYQGLKEVGTKKVFVDRWDSTEKFSEMIDYICDFCLSSDEYSVSDTIVIIWSVFDLNIWDFSTLKEVFKIVSLSENEQQINDYYNMIRNFIDMETESISRH